MSDYKYYDDYIWDDDAGHRCPECGAMMDPQIDFYDIGEHTERVEYWECPFCGYCGG